MWQCATRVGNPPECSTVGDRPNGYCSIRSSHGFGCPPDTAGTPRSGGTAQTRSRADPERRSAVAREAAAGAASMAPAATTGPVGAPVGDPAGGSIDTASRAAGPKRATRLALSDSVTGACAEIRLASSSLLAQAQFPCDSAGCELISCRWPGYTVIRCSSCSARC